MHHPGSIACSHTAIGHGRIDALPPRHCSCRLPARGRDAAFAAALTVLVAACAGQATPTVPESEVRQLTGAHTRVVWVQGDGSDPFAEGTELVLMGLDTDDARGEHVIRGERASYVKPMLTASGRQIVHSTRARQGEPEVFVLNWDGSGYRKLADGFGLSVWADPDDGSEWVYVGTGLDGDDARRVTRFPIDNPGRRELVWDETTVSTDTFQVSADGRWAGGLFPWPEAGVAELPNKSLRRMGEGCWTAMMSVRGPLFWYFDGSHRNLTLVDVFTERRWAVRINQVPGFEGAEVYHPRWTNHPRFLVISGPYNQGGGNQVRSGGAQTEVYVGRFSADFTRVEAWARVTSNARGDSYPDVWIDLDGSPHAQRPGGPIGPVGETGDDSARAVPATAPDAGRLVARVRLSRPGPIPSPEAIAPYRHALVINEYEVLTVLEGRYDHPRVPVAQWAIRDRRLLASARKPVGTEYTLTLERYDAHPELEGERLITDSDADDLVLYYDLAEP